MAKNTSRAAGKVDELKGRVKAAAGQLRGRLTDEAAGKRQKNRGKLKQAAGDARRAGRKIIRDVRS